MLFAREGADVAIVYLPSEQATPRKPQRFVEDRRPRMPAASGRRHAIRSSARAVEKTVHEFGRLDILVNNAAFQEHAESLEESPTSRFDRPSSTNVYGYFYMAQGRAAAPRERARRSSTPAPRPGSGGSAELLDYSATKGAIHAFTKSLATNLRRRKASA